jgi:hypothetical protein
MSFKTKRIRFVRPEEDQGAEARAGFVFQDHCVARLSLWMICDNKAIDIFCEYHEDGAQQIEGQSFRFFSIKKRESVETWTVDLVREAITKLFGKVEYRDVGELIIYGSGRPSSKGEFSLATLITLLDINEDERDDEWEAQIHAFACDMSKKKGLSKFGLDIIKQGLRLLKIRLDMPHPDAICSENISLTAETIRNMWQVEVSHSVAARAYNNLYNSIQGLSNSAKRPASHKRISRYQALQIIKDQLIKERYVAEDPKMLLDTLEKLRKVELTNRLPYVLQKRMDSRQVKFMLDIGPEQWLDLRLDVSTQWSRFQVENQNLTGTILFRDLRQLLAKVGTLWRDEYQNKDFDQEFAVGLFCDMVAVCEADFTEK